MLRSPLSWVGGKHRIREQILALFPPHRCYVELFAGAAWVLFGKQAETSRSEVLNDLDGELINFYRVLKHRPSEFTEAASWLLASRELWQNWQALPGVGGEVLRAVRFYAVIKLGFGSQRTATSFGSKNGGRPSTWWANLRVEARQVVTRLRQVWIEHLPWEACVKKFDGPETFFYIDPPYHCAGSKGYAHRFTDDDHRRLAAALCGSCEMSNFKSEIHAVRGKWLLSYNDDAFIRSLYQRAGLTIDTVRVPYSIARTGRQHASELLIRNY
jgi:DNA adenine methylase